MARVLAHANRWRLHFGAVRAAVWLCFRASDFLLAAGGVADKLAGGLYAASKTMAQAAGRRAVRFRHVTDHWGG